MGANSSSMGELANNDYLKRLASNTPINPIDPFLNQLLSYSFLIPINSADGKLLEESTVGICKTLAINNARSGNFGALVRNFLVRATELKASAQCEDNIFTWQTYNALFVIRSLCKYFVEHLSEELILQQFEAKPPDMGGYADPEDIGPLTEELMNSLVELLVDVPVVSFTYALHLEALNTLLVLLSLQMFQPQPASKFVLYKYIMQGRCSIHACLLVKSLLRNFSIQEKCPPELYKHTGDGNSVMASVAASFWSVMTLGMGGATEKKDDDFHETLLANQSLLFMLVLTNHCTTDHGIHNPYRQALFAFTNSQDPSSSSPTQTPATFKLDFSQLYDALCVALRDDQSTLLLYLLIHRNTLMKAFILSRTNIDQLVMPLLKILYHAQDRNSHHIYMALIILLILSEDEVFNKAVHEIVIRNIPWFKERPISEITLGGLLILVVIRTIQYNMTRMRDKYLHTNCLAALANMSSQFTNLHPYVAQRLVSLFSQLCKKHSRIIEQIRQAAMEPAGSGEAEGGAEKEDHEEEPDPEQDYMQDLAVLEEVLRMMLEILNSCLSSSLHHNPNLVYTLLYRKELFAQFRTHPTFQDIIQNVDTVLSFFNTKLEQNGHKANVSPAEVLELIKDGSKQFRRDHLRKFPDLKFKYVEEESPEEFFIPYIWSLVYHSSNMYFNASRIVLFSLTSS
ncbi:dymeclin-like [Mizuhopecten yessoensis]|uniref:Dymeclin n=1 Tax=Mizuhopecten yessoensis TaxID=6573 RepID=A0A210PQ79_MIZYE|nr:dymeclin-like [Mizuhopecten yessoensis]OWF38655.1 Dymeclin [Mizuhopecten yessoensis]